MMTWDQIVGNHKEHFANCYCGYSCGNGWLPLINGLSTSIEMLGIKGFEYHQIKEKFGILTIYWGMNPETCEQDKDKAFDQCEIVRAMVMAISNASVKTCEECGKNGEARKGGWIKTLCDDCQKERYKNENKD